MRSRIDLKGLKFFAHHGLYDQEREKGSWFAVDIHFHCDIDIAMKKDDIAGTVNYEEIYRIVQEEMKISSKLIEHVAARIHLGILKEVKGVYQLNTTLYKLEAPLGGPLDYVSISLKED